MKFGFAADTAINGLEGVNKVKQRLEEDSEDPCFCEKKNLNYKLILMDCNMPVMDGFEATSEIRKLPFQGNDKIYITALTANARDEVKEECLKCGMEQVLCKPVS